jgi:hypothetical protein
VTIICAVSVPQQTDKTYPQFRFAMSLLRNIVNDHRLREMFDRAGRTHAAA